MNFEEEFSAERAAYFEKKMAVKRGAYEAGNIGALEDAVALCRRYKAPLPEWLSDALLAELKGQAPAKSGRHANWLQQHKEDLIDFVRHDAVEECREQGVPPNDSFYAAHLLLLGNFGEGAESTIKDAWGRYNKRVKTNPYRYQVLASYPLPEFRHDAEAMKEIGHLIQKKK